MVKKSIPTDVSMVVLHEAAYKCANPRCRYPITLDRHHMDPCSNGGANTADNLIALCPTCHREHHSGLIPLSSIRAWKMLLVAVNEAFDRHSVDLLLAIHQEGELVLSGGECAPLIASGLVNIRKEANSLLVTYFVSLNQKGTLFVKGWKNGNQAEAIPDMFT